jgi:O-antigen/teichoic acid export membrane protein
MSAFIMSIAWITELGIQISKKTKYNLYSYFLFIIFGTLILYFSSINFGLYGVSISILISQMIFCLTITWFAYKSYYIEWPYLSISKFLLMTIFIGFICSYSANNFHYLFALFFAILFIFILLFYAWKFLLNINECNMIIKTLKNI